MNTKSIDIITIAPGNCDYPKFRKFLLDIHSKFNKIYYVFTSNNEPNYIEFIKKELPFVNFLYSYDIKTEWRNDATNLALNNSTANGIIFIEPDFIISSDDLYELPYIHDIIGYYWNERIWPSFLYVKRELIERTDKNFSAGIYNNINNITENWINRKLKFDNTIQVDHFGKFTSDLLNITKDFYFLNENGIKYKHYAGITHNFYLCRNNILKNVHNPNEFVEYLIDNLNVDVKLDIRYINETKNMIELLTKLI